MISPISALSSTNHLSLREKVAQLIFVRIGSNLPPVRRVEEDEERVARLLEECPVGGLLLFNGGANAKQAVDRLQAASRVPLLVGSDVERGVGQQVKGYTLFPHAMAFGKLGAGSERLVTDFARSVASESREVGIHITFAPVADVASNPRNPIINTRAFSDDLEVVTKLTQAFITTAEEAGLCTTAKHFPGHGDTEKDSHDSLPELLLSRQQLESRELVPFQTAIDAGCSLVMTAHVSYPALDASGEPATLSSVILQDLLRDKMGFEGVICSDSLLMAGARDRFSREEDMALAVLTAGVDMLLDLENPARVVDHLVDCVATGKLDECRVDEAFERVWKLKQRVFAKAENGKSVQTRVTSSSPSSLAKQVAEGAIDVLDKRDLAPLPFQADAPLVAILLKPFETEIEPPEQPLGAALRARFGDVQYVQLGPKTDAAAYADAMELTRQSTQLVVAIIVRPAAWHAFGLGPEQVAFVRKTIGERRDVVLACLGVPFALSDYADAAMRICTYSDVPVSQEALAEFLLREESSKRS
jgi:beta-glucosidase-like glycosyl hydrolase